MISKIFLKKNLQNTYFGTILDMLGNTLSNPTKIDCLDFLVSFFEFGSFHTRAFSH